MKTRLIIAVVALLVVGVGSVFAQETYQTNLLPMIDGSKNPEKIPLRTILFLWLSDYADRDKPIVPRETGLQETDRATLLSIMLDFRERYDAQVVMYTHSNDSKGHWAEHYALVDGEWNAIQSKLSSEGLENFSTYLEKEKAGARVSPYDYGLGLVGQRNLAERTAIASLAVPGQTTQTPNYYEFSSGTMTDNGNGTGTFAASDLVTGNTICTDAHGGSNCPVGSARTYYATMGGTTTTAYVANEGTCNSTKTIVNYTMNLTDGSSVEIPVDNRVINVITGLIWWEGTNGGWQSYIGNKVTATQSVLAISSPYPQTPFCQNTSTAPPDWNGPAAIADVLYHSYYKSQTLAWRFNNAKGTPWHPFAVAESKVYDGTPTLCTNYDAKIFPVF